MGKPKFTPGPWKIVKYDNDPRYYIHGLGKEVSKVNGYYGFAHFYTKENAQLASIAPEMLNALELLMDAVANKKAHYPIIISKVQAVINKAKGEG